MDGRYTREINFLYSSRYHVAVFFFLLLSFLGSLQEDFPNNTVSRRSFTLFSYTGFNEKCIPTWHVLSIQNTLFPACFGTCLTHFSLLKHEKHSPCFCFSKSRFLLKALPLSLWNFRRLFFLSSSFLPPFFFIFLLWTQPWLLLDVISFTKMSPEAEIIKKVDYILRNWPYKMASSREFPPFLLQAVLQVLNP